MKKYLIFSLVITLVGPMACGPGAAPRLLIEQTAPVSAKEYRRKEQDKKPEEERNWQEVEAPRLNLENKDRLMALAQQFAPQLREHKDEKFPLSNVESYLKEVGLAKYENGERTILIEPGRVTMDQLKEQGALLDKVVGVTSSRLSEQREDKKFKLFIPWGKGDAKDKLNYERIAAGKGILTSKGKFKPSVPICYAYPHYVKNYRDVGSGPNSDERTAIEIVYIFFNAYNGTISSSVPGVSSLLDRLGVGHHEGDFERLTIRLNTDEQTIEGVHYGSHGGNEGIWYFTPNPDLKSKEGYKILKKDDQVVAWSAKDTHGLHNRAAKIYRTNAVEIALVDKILGKTGILTEQTGDGNIMDCRGHLDVIDPTKPLDRHPWLAFTGRWGDNMPMGKKYGEDGPMGPIFQNFWFAEVQNPETWLDLDKRIIPPEKEKKKGWLGF